MGKLIYSAIASVDGYIADASGSFEWAAPDDEVHAYVNDLERPIGSYLYGRRMYEVMSFWETAEAGPDDSAVTVEYAEIWKAADKVVYSRTLDAPSTARTRVEREFDPDAVRALKESSATDLSVGGADLGGQALAAGLVDDLHLFVVPVVVGGGTSWLPPGVSVPLELVSDRTFPSGFVHLHYRVA